MARIQRNRPTATSSQALAGSDGHRVMTPERVAEHLDQYGFTQQVTAESADLNLCVTPGVYLTELQNELSNAPPPAGTSRLWLWVIGGSDGNYTAQIAMVVGGGRSNMWMRSAGNSGLGSEPWVSLATADNSLGLGQSWANVTGSRSRNVVYTNTGEAPMVVAVKYESVSSEAEGYVSGVYLHRWDTASTGQSQTMQLIVPPGATYEVKGNASFTSWFELS